MFLRQLSKLTSMLEGLVPQSHCVHIPRFYRAGSVEVNGEDNPVRNSDQLSFSADSLAPDEMVSALEAKKDLIKGSHIVSALDNFSNQYKHFHKTEQGRHLIEKLIHILELHKNKLSGQETVNILKMLDQLGIRKNSKIYSAMLQRILCCVDDLSLKDFCELSNMILEETIDYSLKHDLQAALEQKFLVRLSMDYEESNMKFFQYALHFISQSPRLLENHDLENILMKKICNNDDIIPLGTAMSMYISLHSLSSSLLKNNALHKVQSDIAEQAHELTSTQIKEIISRMPKQRRGHKELTQSFNEKLANALIRRVIDGKFPPWIAKLVLSRLSKSRYKSTELLQYCCTAYFGKSATDYGTIEDKIYIVKELGMARYRSAFWNEIQEFVSTLGLEYCKKPEERIHLASSLINLDWLTNPLVEKVFDGSFKPSNMTAPSIIFCNIYQRLKLDPSYNGPLPTESQLAGLELISQKRHCVKKMKTSPLLIHLKEGMNGLTGIQSNLTTRFYHDIDHAVALYQDGTPAPISMKPSSGASSSVKYIEDLTVPPNAKLVIVHFFFYTWYFSNTRELMGDYYIILKSLELLPYPVVPINELVWHKLPVGKRTSFIMHAIKEKLNSAQ